MRVLFVWPIVRYSVWDVAKGYHAALCRALGPENVIDYYLDRRVVYHQKAVPEELRADAAVLSKLSTENVINEALYANVDVVLIMSGLNFHPAGLWLLHRAHIPTAVLFTESPYEDDYQLEWVSTVPGISVMTNDAASAQQFHWTYIPHAFDPAIHHPLPIAKTHDVLMIGSGWTERQRLLEAVDWTGVDLRLYGIWPELTETSPLHRFYIPGNVKNEDAVTLYSEARICLNVHRRSIVAASIGPRGYELAACGAFQLSDFRPDLPEIFGESVPTFASSIGLEQLIRYYLEHESERLSKAHEAHLRVASHTFDARIPLVLKTLETATQQRKETR